MSDELLISRKEYEEALCHNKRQAFYELITLVETNTDKKYVITLLNKVWQQ